MSGYNKKLSVTLADLDHVVSLWIDVFIIFMGVSKALPCTLITSSYPATQKTQKYHLFSPP